MVILIRLGLLLLASQTPQHLIHQVHALVFLTFLWLQTPGALKNYPISIWNFFWSGKFLTQNRPGMMASMTWGQDCMMQLYRSTTVAQHCWKRCTPEFSAGFVLTFCGKISGLFQDKICSFHGSWCVMNSVFMRCRIWFYLGDWTRRFAQSDTLWLF